MSINARVRKLKRSGFHTYTFSIVENFRDKSLNGRPNHRQLLLLGSVRDSVLFNPIMQKNLWLKIDLALNRLLKIGKITQGDKSKIENRFAEFVSRPLVGAVLPVPPKITAKSIYDKYPILK